MKALTFLLGAFLSFVLATTAMAQTNSRIWSGYGFSPNGQPYSQLSATWNVPKVSWGPTSYNPYGYEYHTAWIGIGGWGDSTLLQMGTESIVTASGAQTNYVWYELYPAVSANIPYSVSVGDTITASLQCTTNCVPNATQTWVLTMKDLTKGWTWTKTTTFASTMGSAEIVLESPTYGQELPLNNYGSVVFGNIRVNGAVPAFTAANSITMTTPYGQTSNPSVYNSNGTFTTCYGSGSLTACPMPAGVTVTQPPPPPTTTGTGGHKGRRMIHN